MASNLEIRNATDELHALLDRFDVVDELKQLIAGLGSCLDLLRAENLFEQLSPAEQALCEFAYASTTIDDDTVNDELHLYALGTAVAALNKLRP